MEISNIIIYRGFQIEEIYGTYYIQGLEGEFDTEESAKEFIDEYVDYHYSDES